MLVREALILNNLNPVAIRIQHKRHILHPAIRQPLLPVDLEPLEPGARRIEVIDRDACSP